MYLLCKIILYDYTLFNLKLSTYKCKIIDKNLFLELALN